MRSDRPHLHALCMSVGILLSSCDRGPEGNAPAGGAVRPDERAPEIRIGERPVTPFPSDLESRTVLRGALVNPADADNYVGYVLTFFGTPAGEDCKTDPNRAPEVSVRRYLKSGARPIATEPISQIWYQSIVTDSARLAAQYLGSDLSLSHNNIAEMVVEDVAKAEVDDNDVDYVELARLAGREPNRARGECRRLLVMRAYLTSVKSRLFRLTGGQGEVGYVAVKVNGSYYTSSEDWLRNLVLAIDARRFDELKDAVAADTVQRVDSLPRLQETQVLIAPRGGFKLPQLTGVRIDEMINAENRRSR